MSLDLGPARPSKAETVSINDVRAARRNPPGPEADRPQLAWVAVVVAGPGGGNGSGTDDGDGSGRG